MCSTARATITGRLSFVLTRPRWALVASTAGRVARQGQFMRYSPAKHDLQRRRLQLVRVARTQQARVTVNGESHEGQMNLAAIVPILYAGGGMMLSPQAKIDDGKLDVVSASGLTRAHR